MERKIRRGDPGRQSYWKEVVRRWKEGGQSVREFCRVEGLRETAFYFWRRKLKRGSGPSGSVGQSPPEASQRLSKPRRGRPSFLPVHVTGPVSTCPATIPCFLQ
jgi:transposase-like protein